MDWEIVVKVVPVVVGVLGTAKFLYDLVIGKRGRMREEYKFAKDFLDAVNAKPEMHPYVREKGYQAIAGDHSLTGDEVEYLLSLQNPHRALRDYVLGRPYLEHAPHAGNLQIAFRARYQSEWSRRWRMWLYSAFYAIFGFAGFSPFVFASVIPLTPSQVLSANVVCLAVCAPYAWLSLKAAARIYRAKMLVTHQHKHTQRIVVHSSSRSVRHSFKQDARDN